MWFGEAKTPLEKEISTLENEISKLKKKVIELTNTLPKEEISNYTLTSLDGTHKKLLDLFGDCDEMILIHNMGPSCPYCTLWADGFNGLTSYFDSRCKFIIETDINLDKLRDFKEKRKWDFTTVSSINSSLKIDLGFKDKEGNNFPGFSTLYKLDGLIYRHAKAAFGPGDDYCSIWPIFDRLKNGVNGWQPNWN